MLVKKRPFDNLNRSNCLTEAIAPTPATSWLSNCRFAAIPPCRQEFHTGEGVCALRKLPKELPHRGNSSISVKLHTWQGVCALRKLRKELPHRGNSSMPAKSSLQKWKEGLL
jgi:hypothetical protein